MTRIDFYVLGGEESADRYELIAKLSEKAAGRKQNVFISVSYTHLTLPTIYSV